MWDVNHVEELLLVCCWNLDTDRDKRRERLKKGENENAKRKMMKLKQKKKKNLSMLILFVRYLLDEEGEVFVSISSTNIERTNIMYSIFCRCLDDFLLSAS